MLMEENYLIFYKISLISLLPGVNLIWSCCQSLGTTDRVRLTKKKSLDPIEERTMVLMEAIVSLPAERISR